MADSTSSVLWRILVIDDNAAIHHDFRKVLGAQVEHTAQAALEVLEADIFGETATVAARPNFEIDSAHQGQEGVAMVRQALTEGRPYTMAFVDMRMPPDGTALKPSSTCGPRMRTCKWSSVRPTPITIGQKS